MQPTNKKWLPALISTLAAALSSHSGVAQEAPATKAQSEAQIGEIIVSARRREERQQDVPVSMTTFTSQDISKFSTQGLADVASLTPQLIIGTSSNPNGGTINLRGVGASDGSAAVEQAVSIDVDGVQVNHSNLIRIGQFDLAQISVLEGPQALFYGKDSPAGVISFKSNDPNDEFEAKIRTGYEFYQQQKYVEALLSGPLTDWLKARIDVYGDNQIGWFQNVAGNDPPAYYANMTPTGNHQNDTFARATLLFQPSDAFEDNFKFSVSRVNTQNGASADAQLYACPNGTPQTAYGYPDPDTCKIDRYYNIGNIAPRDAALWPGFRDGTPYYTSQVYLISNTLNYHPFRQLTLTSVTGYYEDHDQYSENQCFSQLSCLPAWSNQYLTQFSQEFRALTSFGGPVNFLMGAYFAHDGYQNADAVVFDAPISPTAALFDNLIDRKHGDTYSGFGQVTYSFAPQWEFAAGARYTTERSTQDNTRLPSVLNGFAPAGPLVLSPPSVSFANVSPDVTLTWKPDRDLTLYGAYRQGFLAGGFNLFAFQTQGSNNSYRPETAKGGEIGAKGFLFNHQVQFSNTAYFYKYLDIQLNTFDPQILANQVINAGVAKVYGLETQLNYMPEELPGFSIHGTAAYNRARYTQFLSDCYPGQAINAGCNLNSIGGAFTQQNLKGAPLVRAPEWGASIGPSFNHKLTDGVGFSVSLDGNYSSDYFGQPEEDPRSLQKAYWKLNSNFTLRRSDGAWEIALIGRNLTNKLTLANISAVPFTGSGAGTDHPAAPDLFGAVSSPREIILQFTFTQAMFKH